MSAHQFPHYATPFVGRLTELSEITDRLNDPYCRLLTLVGPGGIGKTRLAVEAALRNTAHFADGVYFVPFQPLNSTEFMISAVAIGIGFQFYPGTDPKHQLLDYIREKALLLIIDNMEHLLEGIDLFSEMLNSASQLRILATSRERLSLAEEWVFDVRELNYPTSESETDIESFDAVQLFLQHSRRIQTNFALTSLQKPAVIRICRLVGGMPLGIELAAASVRALSLEELAGEIEHSLDILETPTRNVELRHRNMRATLDPMWNGLSSEQQAIFSKLSIFRGGFSREAAQYVAGASLPILPVLVDRSLLRMDRDGRYDLHELIRQYAEEHLNQMVGERQTVHDQHSCYYLEWLAQKEKLLEGRQQKQALAEIQCEIDNIRAAWNWAVEHKDAEDIAKGWRALWFFYDTRSWYREGEQTFRTTAEALGLNDVNQEKSVVLGKILSAYGGLCFALNMAQDARKFLEQSLTILRQYAAHAEIGFALLRLSEVGMFLEDNPLVARTYLRESLALFQAVGSQWGTAYSLRWLGFAAVYLEEYEEARQLSQKSLDIYEENGDPLGKALALNVAALSALELGEYEAAQRMSQEILVLAFDTGLRWSIPTALTMTGAAFCGSGDYAQARHKLYEGLNDALEIQFMPSVLYALLEIAIYLIATDNKLDALAILSFMLKHPIPPIKGKRPVSRLIAKLQGELDADAFATALEHGESLNLEAVLQTCLDYTRPLPDALQILNDRELQILGLIAKGLSNREIATNLFFSVGTVKWYLHQIYDKLDVGSRTQAIDRARELNLLS